MSARREEQPPRDPAAQAELEELLATARRLSPQVGVELIEKAFWMAREAHAGQRRVSGEPYFKHVVAVASTCAELNLGSNAIAAALLHDTVEDTGISAELLRQEFNPTVALLVDGVSKIGALRFESAERAQAENFRKLLLHMSKDIRILLIKLADRLHNMSTLDVLRRDKQERIARETMDIYAPLAHRLGIGRVKWQLEDLAFKYLEPAAYERVAAAMGMRRESREDIITAMHDRIQAAMDENGIECAVEGRAKHLFSVWRKMQSQHLDADEILDLMAIRIITDSVADCYHALGVVHTLFKPLPQRFKDYVATPKRNGYQSLHTAVINDDGRVFEIQIRTYSMHEIAEFGIAAHWRYKAGGMGTEKLEDAGTSRELDFLRTFLDELKGGEWSEDPSEFMAHLKINLFQDGIFVFTPRGDLHILPVGSTALDFAYAIHTAVGDRCIGAKIDGKIVPLRRSLESGEVVEILTRKDARPSRDWLNFVKTSKAVSRIKRRLRERELVQSLELGHELLEREFRRQHRPVPDESQLGEVAEALGVENAERVVEGVGRGNLSAASVLNRLYPPEEREAPVFDEELSTKLRRDSVRGVRVEGHGNMMIRFAGCCSPVPGDAIVGVVTRGRGISVHRSDCINVVGNAVLEERRVSVEWDVGQQETFLLGLEVTAEDRPNLLVDITGKIAKTKTNIKSGSFDRDERDMLNHFHFTLEVKDTEQLEEIVRQIKSVRGVQDVYRR
ncbi:MAG: bifunctional (p)ppGpp synthetase/guanosine-3',5'-bis(diphosphate) 3'-pyrophosphohydrolase [Candidatus Krumholzibacteriia bacterium]|nr:bifunctional (p)ppGpp synthetase/guanosine-3',5'-bis(diphosphate) 3'-pyrophosphohydrolase [Candidatus Latescibacterota bacterium]MCB9516917.1 bifunctional (p)ppGpp synthetase/guanosine-3',5'-bis(diphosphate) 3'-pyrophosphohydrolase [Candidatus Latescibacterota bacterium]